MADETGNQATKAAHAKIDRLITWFLWLAFMLVVGGVFAWVYGYNKMGGKIDGNNIANFGSYLQGAVGSLWSLAGFFLIVVAFLSQRKENISQDAQFELQRAQAENQYQSIKRQNFESAFFQLLALHNQRVNEMQTGDVHGKICFSRWYLAYGGEFDQWLRRQRITNPKMEDYAVRGHAIGFYNDWFSSHESQLGPYFRNLYHIIKFVKQSDVSDKRRYTSLVRAQLSKFELFFLFYNCVSPHGEGFRPLIEEFGLLEHFDKKLLYASAQLKWYADSAYE